MSDQPYRRPPITEAIIEVRFADPLEASQFEKAAVDFKDTYPIQQPTMAIALGVAPDAWTGSVAQINQTTGSRLSSPDQTELAVLWPQSFVVSQLAPYPGWNHFFGRFERDWQLWKRAMGYRKIARVGLRYINRIDIPNSGQIAEEADFLNVFAKAPDNLGPFVAYGVQVQFLPDEHGCKLVLNSALVPSPLLNHTAIVLDLDAAVEFGAPQNDKDLYLLLNEMRHKKNSAFEACVTDRARELFQL